MPINRTGQGQILKVVELGLEHRVYGAMKQPRFSVEALTREFKEEGIDITAQSIRKFIRKTKAAQKELISSDMKVANEVVKLTLDYGNEMKAILDEVKEMKTKVKDEGDMGTYNQLVGRLMQGIELAAKLTGDLKPKTSSDITVIYNQINTDMETAMKHVKSDMFRNVVDIDAEIEKADEQEAKKILR